MPDHPGLLQSLIWQHMDIAPAYPVRRRFLSFWEREIKAELHSVKVSRAEILSPAPIRCASGLLKLH